MKKVIFIYILTVAACLCKPADNPSGVQTQPPPAGQTPQVTSKAERNAKEEAKAVTPIPDPKAGAGAAEQAQKEGEKASDPKEVVTVKTTLSTLITTNSNETPKSHEAVTETSKKQEEAAKPLIGKDEKTTTAKPAPAPITQSSTTTTTPKTTTGPANAKPTEAPATDQPLKSRGFDGGSFVGGIILTLGLLAIGFMGFKYYKNQTERNYHTL